MPSVVIIKLGAVGDVLRTSYLINAFNKDLDYTVTWITSEASKDILTNNPHINKILIFNKDILPSNTDILICLEDKKEFVVAASKISANKVIGSYINANDNLEYTDDVSEWFDMGIISKYGLERANTLKKENNKSFNEIFTNSLSIKIDDIQPKVYFKEKTELSKPNSKSLKIGLNLFAGNRWPSKELKQSDSQKLIDAMSSYLVANNINYTMTLSCDDSSSEKANYIIGDRDIKVINTNNNISEYSNHVRKCDFFITTDSLGMHLAIANNIRHIAFFNPTSAVEIDNFNSGVKVISQSSGYCSYEPYAKYDKTLWKNVFNQWITEVEQFILSNK